jgi:K+ transporter
LIVLFLAQRFGTDKVGYTFAPIILTWFILIAGIGVYNLSKHDTSVLKAFNPKYIVDYFKRNGKQGWISLGGVILCITGTFAPRVCNGAPKYTWVSTISPYYFASTKHVRSLSTFFNVVTFFYKTGTEAMFADLGHFNVRAVQVIEYVFPILSPSFSEYVNTLTGPSKKDSGKLCLWRLEKLLECVEKIVLKRKKNYFHLLKEIV